MTMEYTHYTTIYSMLQALAAGAVWGLYYDVFRLLRRMIHFSGFSVALQDVFFWLTSAVYIFFVCVRLNNGYIRIYFVIFALVGWGIYFATLGRVAFAVFDKIIGFLRRIFEKVKAGILSLLAKIYIKIRGKK